MTWSIFEVFTMSHSELRPSETEKLSKTGENHLVQTKYMYRATKKKAYISMSLITFVLSSKHHFVPH